MCADGRIEAKNKSSQAERREVERKRCSATLFEENKEADEKEDRADEIDVIISRRPFVNRIQSIQICVVLAALYRI